MSGMIYEYKVTMESGAVWEVTADQRDIATWEVQPFGCPVTEAFTRIYTWSRFLAWNAGRRAKLHTLSWADFGDQCVSAERVNVADEKEGEKEDPGHPAASAGS